MKNEIKLGQLINKEEFRDAIHIAIAPVVAGDDIQPGEHIGFWEDGTVGPVSLHKDRVGVADPFLRHSINKGQTFWMLLYPQTITSLRHEWTHPAFKTNNPVPAKLATASEMWIAGFAGRVGLTYNELMQGAKEWIEHEEYLDRGYSLVGEYVPDEFWVHYENVTGQKGEGSFFSCSC